MPLLRRLLALASALVLLAPLAAQTGKRESEIQGLRIVSLHPVLTELASELTGPAANVTGLVRGGVDPHSFDPSPADARLLTRADLVLASGLGLETYLDKFLDAAGARPRLFTAGDALGAHVLPLVHAAIHETARPHTHDHNHSEADPHWWHSVAATRTVASALADRLVQLRPASAPAIRARAAIVLSRLDTLAVWATATMAIVPPARRQLVTTHDAFGYFARDHGFIVHPINGPSTASETNARHLAQLITLLRREKIPAVFAEASEDPRLIAQLVRETGVKLGGSLVADGLAPSGPAATYDGMIRQNLATIVAALR